MTNWIKDRMREMTSWNGAAMIAVGLIVLFATPLAKWAAYAAILYGAYSIWKSED